MKNTCLRKFGEESLKMYDEEIKGLKQNERRRMKYYQRDGNPDACYCFRNELQVKGIADLVVLNLEGT